MKLTFEELKQLLWEAYTAGMNPMTPKQIQEEIIPAFEAWLISRLLNKN
jgi:hypothetical protein